MILSDLSRQKHDACNLHEIILISFNMQVSWQARYYNTGKGNSENYLIQTQSQAKSSGVKLPEVHGIGKSLDLNIQPENQIVKQITVTKAKEVSQIKPRLGQGRAGLRCKIKTSISKSVMQVTEKLTSKVLLANTSKIQDIAIPIPITQLHR